jgi:hypothetical protein
VWSDGTSTLTVTNGTIVGNSAVGGQAGSGGSAGVGQGGDAYFATGGTVSITNTTLGDVFGTYTTGS